VGGHRVTGLELQSRLGARDNHDHYIDLHQILNDRLTDANPDLLRNLLSTFMDALMGLPRPRAGAGSFCLVNVPKPRTNIRKTNRHRAFGTHFPERRHEFDVRDRGYL
jgi:hypothetical protein